VTAHWLILLAVGAGVAAFGGYMTADSALWLRRLARLGGSPGARSSARLCIAVGAVWAAVGLWLAAAAVNGLAS
jgi:hypothetical protein